MKTNEPENFNKIITFNGNQLAIVDASVLQALRDVPLADQAVLVPLKTNQENPSFTVTAQYDDAVLRKLVIEPAPADESEKDPSAPPEHEISENATDQLRGHGGDSPARKISQNLNRKMKRSHRNDLNSKSHRPMVPPENKMAGKIGKVGKSPRSDEGGHQPSNNNRKIKKAESKRRNPYADVMENFFRFLNDVKAGNELPNSSRAFDNKELFLTILETMESRCFGGWTEQDDKFINENGYSVSPNDWIIKNGYLIHKHGKNYDWDLIYEAKQILSKIDDEVMVDQSELELFNELIMRKLNCE